MRGFKRANVMLNKPFDVGVSAKATSTACVFPFLNLGELLKAL
jgi:hypothetical protein